MSEQTQHECWTEAAESILADSMYAVDVQAQLEDGEFTRWLISNYSLPTVLDICSKYHVKMSLLFTPLLRQVCNRQASLNETIGVEPPEVAEKLRASINAAWDKIEADIKNVH